MNYSRIAMIAVLGALFAGCGGGGEGPSNPPPPVGGGGPGLPPPASAPALKTTLAARFGVVNYPVGGAIEAASLTGADRDILLKHFSSITAENAMKPDTIRPNAPGSADQPIAAPNFAPADVLVSFATTNNIRVRGHALLWHQTAPTWFFAGDTASPSYRSNVRLRLRDYIYAVIQHYPDIYAWDVVNEVATDVPNAANPYRTDSPWYIAYSAGGGDGSEYVRDAFNYAADARAQINRDSATMKLMLNDYNTELPGKRDNVMRIVQQLINTGTPIDGVGHQFHLQLGADVAQVTAALTAVENLSSTLVNHVTELDVSIYQDPGNCFSARTIPPCVASYGTNPPNSVLSQQATLYRALFTAFNRPSVQSITTWGVADNDTWLNTFPVVRINRPLLFDTVGDPKAAFWAVADPSFVIP
jgi:endo-1,4-beta-xylanase